MSSTNSSDITLKKLNWDSDFFGLKIGRHDYSSENIGALLDLMKKEEFDVVYVFSENPLNENMDLNSKFEINLVDQKVVYAKKPHDYEQENSEVIFTAFGENYEKLYELALEAGQESRFLKDPLFGRKNFEKLYAIWIKYSVNRSIAAEVLITKDDKEVTGLLTLGEKAGRADIGLIAVDSAFRGSGLGRKLIQASEKWAIENEYEEIQVVTQKENKRACTFYESLGFKEDSITYIYHLWRRKKDNYENKRC